MDPEEEADASLAGFVVRAAIPLTLTYWVAGLVFSALFDYQSLFSVPPLATYTKPLDSVWVYAGPLFQPIRGAFAGVVLWPFRRVFVSRTRGWLALWGLFAGLAVLDAPAPAPGSVEGVVYTTIPLSVHLAGLPEVLVQTLAFSVLLVHWERRGADRRLWYGYGAAAALAVAVSVLGLLVEFGLPA